MAMQIERYLFSRRLLLSLPVVIIGLFVVRPHNLFGKFHLLGMIGCTGMVLAGLGLRAWAAACAGGHTRSAKIEGKQLATDGPYAHVRNPIYLGSFVLGLGMIGLLEDPWLLIPHVLLFITLFYCIVRAEENHLRKAFGTEYLEYCRAVPRIIPRISPWKNRTKCKVTWSAAWGDLHIAIIVALIYLAFRARLFLFPS